MPVKNIATVDNNGLITAIAEGETYIVVTTADGGFQDSCKIAVEPNLGIENVENQEITLKIYPNPTTGKLRIKNEELRIEAIELFDLSGKLLGNYKIIGKETEIDISHLPNGTYLVKVGNISTKVVENPLQTDPTVPQEIDPL